MESCPSFPELGVKETEHEPPESEQTAGLKVPDRVCEKFTLPDGVVIKPPPVSDTCAVQVVLEFTGTSWGEHELAIVVGRLDTCRVKSPELPA